MMHPNLWLPTTSVGPPLSCARAKRGGGEGMRRLPGVLASQPACRLVRSRGMSCSSGNRARRLSPPSRPLLGRCWSRSVVCPARTPSCFLSACLESGATADPQGREEIKSRIVGGRESTAPDQEDSVGWDIDPSLVVSRVSGRLRPWGPRWYRVMFHPVSLSLFPLSLSCVAETC